MRNFFSKPISKRDAFAIALGLSLAGIAWSQAYSANVLKTENASLKSEIASLKTEASQTPDEITDLKLPAGLSVKNGKYLCPTNKKTFARVQFYGMQSCNKFFEGMKASKNNTGIIADSDWYQLAEEPIAELSQVEAIQTYQKAPSPPKGIRMFVITNQAKQYSVTSFFTPLKPEGVSSADTDPNTRTSVYLLNPIQKNKD